MVTMTGTGVYLKVETLAALDVWASAEGRSRSNLLRKICDEAIAEHRALQQLAHAFCSGTAQSVSMPTDGEQ